MSDIAKNFFEQVKQNHQERAAEAPGQLSAMAREAVKDIRSTLMEVFFGSPEHTPEQGTPLNPTPQMVTREIDGQDMGREI